MQNLDLLLLQRSIDRLIAPFNTPNTPGITVGFVRDGDLILHRHAGFASLELAQPITENSTFRIASVSKQFTCAAILLLAAEAHLSPTDPIQTHLPELPDFGAPITIAHLMHNTSGLRDMLELMRFAGTDLGVPVSREDLMQAICRQRTLNFAPGSRYLYSNTNFLLLGRIAERVSGQPLPSFLEQRIFTPLGMTQTRMIESTTEVVENLTTGYLPAGKSWTRAQHGFALGGEGGLVSCVQDLALWVRNASTARVGGPALIAGLETLEPFTNGAPNTYARGLNVHTDRGTRIVEHGGLWPGYKTQFLRAPEHGLAVIVISNNGAADPFTLAHSILDIALPSRAPLPKMPNLDRLPGRYLDGTNNTTIELAVTPEGLPQATTNGVPFILRATETGALARRAANDFTLTQSADGNTLHVTYDARAQATLQRVTDPATLPTDLDGAYENPEIAATWTITGANLTVAGPLIRNTKWDIEPVAPDFIRAYATGSLFRAWIDIQIQRTPTGTIQSLQTNGGRARGLTFAKNL